MIKPIKIAVFGAGPVGMTTALHLSELGHHVTVFEKRKDYVTDDFSDKRSINLTLSERGMKTLRALGLENNVSQHSVSIIGREVHRTGKTSFVQLYGAQDQTHLYSITRKDLIKVIYAAARAKPNIIFKFETTLLNILSDDHTCLISDNLGQTNLVSYDVVIGADGVNSIVKHHVQQKRQSIVESSHFEWGYRSFTLSAEMAVCIKLEKNKVHIFGSDSIMIFAFANRDNSFSGNIFTSFGSENSFDCLNSSSEISEAIKKYFPDLNPVADVIAAQICHTPNATVQYSVTDKCQTSGSVILVGDALRSVYHFYAQGVNAGLEDSMILSELFKTKSTILEALEKFELSRIESSKALVRLSRDNFYYLQQSACTYLAQGKYKVESFLSAAFPLVWPSTYQLVCNGRVNFRTAEKLISSRILIWKVLCLWLPQILISLFLIVKDKIELPIINNNSFLHLQLNRKVGLLITAAFISAFSLIVFVNAAQSAEVKIALAFNQTEADQTLWNASRAYIRKAAMLAIEDLGPELKKRGIQIKLVPFDIGNNVAKAVEAANAIVHSDAAAVVGFPKSSEALIAAEAFTKHKIAFVTPSGSADRLSVYGGMVKSGGPSTSMQARVLIDTVVRRKLLRMGMVTVADCAFCQSLRAEITKELEKRSIKLVYDEVVLSSSTRFKESFAKLSNSSVDVIFLPNYEFESSSIITALDEVHAKTTAYVGCTAWADMSTILSNALVNAKIESIILALWDKKIKSAYAIRFENRFSKKFSEPPHDVAALAYNAMLIAIRAVVNAKKLNREAVALSLLELRSINLLTGRTDFIKNKTFSSAPMNILIFKGANLISVKPVEMI